MAGIYIHIPFCKTRCIYCDFYSTTRSELKSQYIRALCRELTERKEYLKGEAVETIYFGGGTPSQLSEEDFKEVFKTIEQVYGMREATEITLEANPDDLTEEYIGMLHTLPFNRISMGIQTFDDATLQLLNRRHNATQAIEAVKRCRQAGFQNISIDLILDVEDISAYHLIYEEGTPLYKMLQQHSVSQVDEDSSLNFFSTLIDTLSAAGYEHYEISNFCKPGMYSRHNTSYWQGIPYLGCGPSAHSFDGDSREWNVASLNQYLSSIEQGQRKHETEQLDTQTRYNEYIITGLRTMWGISTEELKKKFGDRLWKYCLEQASSYLENGKLELHNDRLKLTREGIFISDGIMSDLLEIE